MTQETIAIGRATITKVIDGTKIHCEATCDSCTGHGTTMVEAYLDLRKKIKLKEFYNSLLGMPHE